MRRIVLAIGLVSGCEDQIAPAAALASAPEPREAQAPESPAEPAKLAKPDLYAAYNFPPVTDDWGLREYVQVRDAILDVERNEPRMLPTLAGPKGDVLARVASLDALDRALASNLPVEELFQLGDTIAPLYDIYSRRALTQQGYGAEYLLISAAFVHAASSQLALMIALTDEPSLRAEPARLDDLIQMRHGLIIAYGAALEAPLQFSETIDAREAVAKLEPVTAAAAAFMLPDERRMIAQYLAGLGAAGADSARVAGMRATIAETPMHPIFAAFVEEAQAYSNHQRQWDPASNAEKPIVPVELGRERGGVRHAFPDAGFSAVFSERPSASISSAVMFDGGIATNRMLGGRDAAGYSTAVGCVSRSGPPGEGTRDIARQFFDDVGATDIREIEIDGRRGLEGTITEPSSRGLFVAIEFEFGICSISVGSPLPQPDNWRQQAGAFVNSVKWGDFGK